MEFIVARAAKYTSLLAEQEICNTYTNVCTSLVSLQLQQHSGQKQTHRVALETWLSKQGFAHDKHRGWHQVKGGAGQSQPGSAEQGQPDESARQGQKRKHEESVIEGEWGVCVCV